MTLTDALQALIAKCDAATPGPWRVVPQKGYCTDYIVTDHHDWQGENLLNYIGETGLADGQEKRPQKFQHDSTHIASLSPEVARAMAEAALAAEEMRQFGQWHDGVDTYLALDAKLDSLAAALGAPC